MFRKVLKFLSSMKFAIILLVILALACAAGSFLSQHQSYEWYASRYSERTAAVIYALALDDVYHSIWFLILTAVLCCNLLFCNLLRFKPIFQKTKDFSNPKSMNLSLENSVDFSGNPCYVFKRLRFPAPIETELDGKTVLFSQKNRIGLWGAWICHLGILLLILGFTLGQMTRLEYAVYGVSGQTKPIADTNYLLTIDDFQIGLNEDDSVSQYSASLTVREIDSGETQSAQVSVNYPASLFGYQFYQNSTGWAADVSVLKNGILLQEEILCAGEYFTIEDLPELAVCFNAFYPDFVMIEGKGPATASGKLVNPAYLYSIYYGEEILGMNALFSGEVITIDDYEIQFSNPRNYTVIQIKSDRFTPLALLGGIITMIGLFLAFYLQPKRLLSIPNGNRFSFIGQSRRDGPIFCEELSAAVNEARNVPPLS